MKNRHKQAVNKRIKKPFSEHIQARIREGFFLLTLSFSLFLFASLLTYHSSDPGWSSSGLDDHVQNMGGHVGAWLSDILLTLLGYTAYFFPFLIILTGFLRLKFQYQDAARPFRERSFAFIGLLLIMASSSGLMSLYFKGAPVTSGGILGDLLAASLIYLFSSIGASLIFVTGFLCGTTFFTGFSWLNLFETLGRVVFAIFEVLQERRQLKRLKQKKTSVQIQPVTEAPARSVPLIVAKPPRQMELKEKKEAFSKDVPKIQLKPGAMPPLSLLNAPAKTNEEPFSKVNFTELSALVEERLQDFGVTVKVVGVQPGPVVTRFELELAPGVKVSKISGLAKDIARSLSAVSVRIVEVIPGKSVIGLEIPNEHREMVTLREMFECDRYTKSQSPVSLVLGKDISGVPMVVDLAKMPHLLVAGTTGSGKSVSLNAMLLSMLYKATPEQLRLILIDPKMLELSVYEGIPHLLTPVITDMKDAANALRWCVAEMDRRYRLMAALGVRSMASFNHKVQEAIKAEDPIPMPHSLVEDEASAKMHLQPLPMIVVVADELADMMMVVGKKVEDLIARIAQKARAAGIHLILATQRPSVDVITGLIKANIPTRIAFQVSSRIDSRTILDQQGAEQLLGHGDMLYLPPGLGVPIRVHGAYVADEEVHRVASAWRSLGPPVYLHDVTEDEKNNDQQPANADLDPLYDEAVKIVTETKRASISLVQRKLRIGYNRAARMMEEMEAAGLVSSMDLNGAREVLINAQSD